MSKNYSKFYKKYGIIVLLLITLFFSFYRLSESPSVWYDEGFYTQAARNLSSGWSQGVQTEPGEISSPAYITVGYPLIYPVSLSFRYFGVGVLQARAVMVLFILLLVYFSYLLIKDLFGTRLAIMSSLLLSTFPVLYGNGKSVLGEVPGLFFLVSFLFLVHKIEENDFKGKILYILAGLASGLCLVTKPIFLVLLPAILVSIFLVRKNIYLNWKLILVSFLSFLVPIAFWFKMQFAGNPLSGILSYYANPYVINDLSGVIIKNLVRFLTELSPMYFLVLSVTWVASIFIRGKRNISFTEAISFSFSFLIWLAYLRTPGWYRYFFPANIIILLYFPFNLKTVFLYLRNKFIWLRKFKIKFMPTLVVVFLILINLYQLGFSSWVATYYSSTKSRDLTNYFRNYSLDKSILFYNVPEVVIFLPTDNYYQYLVPHEERPIGVEQLDKIELGIPDEIIINTETFEGKKGNFTLYEVKDKVNRYTILEKK